MQRTVRILVAASVGNIDQSLRAGTDAQRAKDDASDKVRCDTRSLHELAAAASAREDDSSIHGINPTLDPYGTKNAPLRRRSQRTDMFEQHTSSQPRSASQNAAHLETVSGDFGRASA
jgi:hypothetical protein